MEKRPNQYRRRLLSARRARKDSIPPLRLFRIQRNDGTSCGALSRENSDTQKFERGEETPGQWVQRFQPWFDINPLPLMAFDRENLKILAVNEAAIRHYGYSRKEFLAMTVQDIRPPEDIPYLHGALREGDRGFSGPFTGRHRKKDGTVIEVEAYAERESWGARTIVLAQIHDVTERKRVEEALRLSQERFRLLVEGAKEYAIFMLDPEGRVASWNSGAERLKGYQDEEIIGQHFSRFYSPEDVQRGKPEEDLRLAAARGQYDDEGWRVRKDGSQFWADVIITALKDEAGRLRGFSKVTHDVTARKRAEEALLLQVTNVLIANLDIRQLLTAIAAGIHQVMPNEYAAVALYDPELGKLRLQTLTAPFRNETALSEALLPIEGSPAAVAFTAREPLVLNDLSVSRFPPEVMQPWRSAGAKSACWLPLINRSRVLGTLILASREAGAFTQENVRLLMQVAAQVAVALDNAMAYRHVVKLKDRLAEERSYLEEELRTEYNFEEIVGESAALKRVLKQVETVAPTDATVLIQGETGTGKELIARAIHRLSARRERTFVRLNCAAIPTGLLESELFGHEKGAFTGAIAQKIGRLELSHQGTLFLDEVGDIPLEVQPKLLRTLQGKEFERLGSSRTILVDVRLIAATNRNLAKMVEDRQFRSDLYYRLKVFPITVPSLRERPEDIPLLVWYFVQKYAQRMNKKIGTISPETMKALSDWHWPGNVRELESLIERAVIVSQGGGLRVPLAELKAVPEAELGGKATLEAVEREHILRILRETGGVISGPHGAAARLGLPRTTLNAKLRKLGIYRKNQ